MSVPANNPSVDSGGITNPAESPIELHPMTQPVISGGMSNPAQPPIDIHMTEEEVKYENAGLPTWAVKWSILWTNVILEETVLGRGYFGEVRLGVIKMGRNRVTKAAIKMLIGWLTIIMYV